MGHLLARVQRPDIHQDVQASVHSHMPGIETASDINSLSLTHFLFACLRQCRIMARCSLHAGVDRAAWPLEATLSAMTGKVQISFVLTRQLIDSIRLRQSDEDIHLACGWSATECPLELRWGDPRRTTRSLGQSDRPRRMRCVGALLSRRALGLAGDHSPSSYAWVISATISRRRLVSRFLMT